jgi:hypothetical protein
MPAVRTTILIAVVLCAAPSVARSECAVSGLVPVVLTRSTNELPADGGIVIAAQSQGGNLPSGEVTVQPAWRIAIGKMRITPTIQVVAPGLAVYRWVGAAGEVVLLDKDGKELVTVRATKATQPPPAAPVVKKAWRHVNGRRHSTLEIGVEVDAVPADAVALVLADDKGKPRSFGPTSHRSATTLYPLYQPSCALVPNGTETTKVGDRITLLWVDDAGRVSPPSKPIVVVEKL